MHRRQARQVLAAFVMASVLAGGTVARGAGFALYEMSARGNALGGALVGFTGDASANYFNPANMTELENVQVMAGLSFINPGVEVTTLVPTPMGPAAVETDNDTRWWTPPHAYGSMQVSERMWVGVGVYSPYGLGSVFEEEWPGRYNSYKAIIETVDVNPNVAWKVDEKLSVAAGLQIMTFDLQLKRKIPNPLLPGGPDLDFELDGDSVGYGGNAAVAYRITDNLGVGAVYRSEVRQSVEGYANATAGGRKMSTAAEGDVVLPASSTAGANYRLKKLTLGAAVTYTEWESFDELSVSFANPAIFGRSQTVTPKDWNNVWRYGVGAEYALSGRMDVRCSYVYDEDPIPDGRADYLVPSDDRHLFGLGMGWRMNGCRLDLGYTYLLFEDRKDVAGRPEEGVLPSSFEEGTTHILAASLSAAF